MPLPSVRFALVLALTAIAFLVWPGDDWLVFWTVELVVVAIFVVDALSGVAPGRIVVHREHPPTVAVGSTATMRWVIENHGRKTVRVTVSDALWPSLRASRRTVSIALQQSSRHVATAELWPSRRGRFPFDAITVRVSGPLRLAVRQRTRSVPTTLRVMPAYPSRDEVQRRLRQPRIIDVGLRTLRLRGSGTDFDQLREFRPGDDSRRIDWAATARSQRPIVRQYRAERNQSVVILLDNGRIMAGSVAGVPRVEHAMDAALALTHVATHLGDRVGLVAFDHQVRTVVAASNSKAQLARVSEAMFLLEPDLNESSYRTAFTYATARFRRRSLYVVLTDLADSAVEQAILPALPIVARRHLVVIATLQDPLVQQWASGSSDQAASAAYRRAAAVTVMQQRRRSSARLEAAGAIVIDCPPGHLARDLVDRYLELKAAGRL